MLPLLGSALLPESQWRSEIKWLICFAELYWLRQLNKKST